MKTVKAKPSDSGAALRRLFLIVAAVAVGLAFHVPSAYAPDVDEDGLDDDLEQFLINTNRPLLKYNSGEHQWPSSVTWKVRHSELLYDTSDHVIYTIDQLNANPMLILSGTYNGESSSTEYNPSDSPYRLNIYDQYRTGSWPTGDEPLEVGMYARVVPLTGYIVCDNYPDLSDRVQAGDLLIQYYQFFPFNDYRGADNPLGDHEGDWLFLDVFVAGTPPYAQKAIVYHHHGDGDCPPDALTGSLLPKDGVPVCYLEIGGHEWWPVAGPGIECYWYLGFYSNSSHDGNGPNVRAQNVLNIGEHFAPMDNDEAKMIAFFNGRWGYSPDPGMADSPPGPLALTSDRCFCVQAPRFVAYVRHHPFDWPSQVNGTRYYPARWVSQGIAVVSSGGHVRIAADSYPGAMTITKACTLETWGAGPVIIGP